MTTARPKAGTRSLVIWTDGAARGNPGPAGAGACLRDRAGNLVSEHCEYLGRATNNVAEYRALLLGLEQARALGAREVEVRADSQLMVRQLHGEYAVRAAGLKPLFARALRLAGGFDRIEFVHVPRDDNKEADRLANRAIDDKARSRTTDSS